MCILMNGLWVAVQRLFNMKEGNPNITLTMVLLKKRKVHELLAIETHLHNCIIVCLKHFNIKDSISDKDIYHFKNLNDIDENGIIEFLLNMKTKYFHNIFNLITTSNDENFMNEKYVKEKFNINELIRHYTILLITFKHVISLWEKNKDVSNIQQRGVKLEALRTLCMEMEKISIFIPQTCLAMKEKKTLEQEFEEAV
jgi:hypothetical protein